MTDGDMESRVARLENKLGDLDKNTGILSALFERSVASQDKFSDMVGKLNETMSDLKMTMSSMQTEIKDTMEQICETRKEISAMKDSIHKVEEKGKIDWMDLVKQNIVKVILGGGLIIAIITWGIKALELFAK